MRIKLGHAEGSTKLRSYAWHRLACAALISITAQAALPAPICPALELPAVTTVSWDDDTAYEMTIRDVGGGRLRITIVGDILTFDSTRFTSMVRRVDKAPGNVDEVILDGRDVRILEPLSLQNGRIRIHAQTVSFEGVGVLALTQPPGAAVDGLEINAAQLDMRRALPVAVQMAVAPGSARQVVVRARSLVATGGVLQGDAAVRWMWQHSTNFDGAMPANFPPNWKIDVGETGFAQAMEAMQREAAWPGYTAYKIRKFHAFAPFDESKKKLLSERIDGLRPALLALQRAEALADVDAVSLLMSQNLDRRGFGPAYVPSEDLVVAMGRFKTSRDDARKRFADLRTVIVSAHQTPQLKVDDLQKARSRIRTLSESQTARREDIGKTFTTLAGLEAQGVEVGKVIEVEREVSRKRLEERKDAQNDLEGIKVATMVVAIGASFIGTPAAGAAIAAGVGAVGDVVYAHNAGRPMNVETLSTIAAKNGEYFKQMKETREAWSKHNGDLDIMGKVFDGKKIVPEGTKTPLSKTQAAQKAGESAVEFAKKLKAAADGVGAFPKPDSVSLNQVEAENGALQEQLVSLAKIQTQISEEMKRLQGQQAALAADEAAVAETRLVEQVLLELKPANDQDILRWKTAALQLWARELQGLYEDAMDLRRSLYFETWKAPTLPSDVLAYPEEFTAYLASGRYSPEKPGATSPATLTDAHLVAEVARHMAVLDGIASAVDRTWQTYQAERAAGAQPYFDEQVISAGPSAPVAMRLFMEQVNAQIRQQIKSPKTRGGDRFQLLIPFDMTSPPIPALPERLLNAGVAEPRFAPGQEVLEGKTLAFDVTYRLAGELRRTDSCSYVDLSLPGGRSVVTRREKPDSVAAARARYDQPLTFQRLRESRTAPPARTLYFLSVTVGGSESDGNWDKVPQLESFTFWRSIVQ